MLIRPRSRLWSASMIVRVECVRSDHGEPVPTRLFIGERTIELAELLDRWPGSDHTYLKLRAEDGATFILRHDFVGGTWELTMFRACGESAWHQPVSVVTRS
jgi:hypothetical protein